MKKAVLALGLAVLAACGLIEILRTQKDGQAARVVDGGLISPRDAPHAPQPDELEAAADSAVPTREEATAEPTRNRAPSAGEWAHAFLRVVEEDGVTPRPGFELSLRINWPNDLLARMGLSPGKGSFKRLGAAKADESGLIDVLPVLRRHYPNDFQDDVPSWHAELQLGKPDDIGFVLQPGKMAIASLGLSADEARTVRLLRRPVAAVRGVAREAGTQRPLADLALRVTAWSSSVASFEAFQREHSGSPDFEDTFSGLESWRGESEWMITDARGRFESSSTYAQGNVTLSTWELEYYDREHVITGPGQSQPLDLTIEIGAKVLLDFTPPGGRKRSDFIAALWRDPEELLERNTLQELETPWSGPVEERENADTWGAPVREGSPAWTRLPWDSTVEPLPSRLLLLTRDGTAFGHARVDDLARHATEPLRVDVEELHTLQVILVDTLPESASEEESEVWIAATIELTPREEGGASKRAVQTGYIDERETISQRLDALKAGAYDLTVSGDGLLPIQRVVQIPEETRVRLELKRAEVMAGHRVEISVVSRSGRPLQDYPRLNSALLKALGPDSDDRTHFGNLLEYDDRRVLSFGSVPPGRYSLTSMFWTGGILGTEISAEGFEVPGLPPVVTVQDDRPGILLELRIIEPPDYGSIEVWVPGDEGGYLYYMNGSFSPEAETPLPRLSDGRSFSATRFGPFPTGTQVMGKIFMADHHCTRFSSADFSPPDADGVRVLELTPVPGWSADVTVYDVSDPDIHVPLSGVVLSLDGVSQPPTDQRGFTLATGIREPRRLSMETGGYELVPRTSWDHWGFVLPLPDSEEAEIATEDRQLTVFVCRSRD